MRRPEPRATVAAAAAVTLLLSLTAAGIHRANGAADAEPSPARTVDIAASGSTMVSRDSIEAARAPRAISSPAARAEAPVPQDVDAADGLDALYAELGLDVPSQLVRRDARPGCTPSSGGTPAVAGEGPPPWTPDDTVAESALPDPGPAPAFTPDASVMDGHGMWIWQYTKTEGGNYRRMVDKAVAAGFDHLWVRVGDSRDGFYAAEYLDALVPLAHEAGLRVIGWGFPFLHDPEADAAWTIQAMQWRGSHGRGLDAYSPDIERETEGVVLSEKRAVVHLARLREAAGDLPIIATVYPPTDRIVETGYPYESIAEWVDGFATMDYWNCGDSGYRANQSIERLAGLRPVHVIGQAFQGGRSAPPNAAETLRFLDTAVRQGATGVSWWVWQHVGDGQWSAISSYPWQRAVASNARNPRPAVIPNA